MPSWREAGTDTLSLARKEGLEAEDANTGPGVAEAVVGVVMPVAPDKPDVEAEECEPGPLGYPIW
jgi:hypothetical protein